VHVLLSDDIKISNIIHISCDKVGVAELPNKSRVNFHVKDVLYWLRWGFGEILNTFAKCIACYIVHFVLCARCVAARSVIPGIR